MWAKWLAPALLLVAVAAAYSNSLHGEFIFDDHQSIPGNPSIRRLQPLSEVLFPPADITGDGGRTIDGRPVLNLSLAVNYALHELDVRGYHLANLILHALAALALYGVVRRTLLLPRWSEPLRHRATPLAFLCALLWALHPLQTESVTYIIQRAESMAGLFYLLTLYASIRAATSRWPAAWYVVSIGACMLGVGTKEVVATAPLVVLLYDRVFLYADAGEMFRRRGWLYAGLAASWFVLLAIMVASPGRGTTVGFSQGVTPTQYVLTQCWAVPHYLRLAIFPYPLVLDYGNRLVTEPAQVLPGLLVMLSLAIGTAVGFRFQPWIGFLGSCFFLILAPTSSFVPIVTQTVAEHRMYLPLAAVVVFVVLAGDFGWRRWQERRAAAGRWLLPQVLPVAAALVIAAVLGGVTYRRNVDYRTAESIWRDTMAKSPGNIRTHANMADVFLAAGNTEAAVRELDICVEMNPESAAHRYNRGTLLWQLQRYDAALEDFSEALRLDPTDAATWHNRGVVWQDVGRHDLAVADFTEAIQRDPQLTTAYQNRARSYHAMGRIADAEADLHRFLQLGGKLPELPASP